MVKRMRITSQRDKTTDDESQIDVNEDGSTGDDLDDEGPTEVDYN